MSSAKRAAFTGPILFSYGFRPFFLAAGVFASVAILAWILMYEGVINLPAPFAPLDWHIHEMIFGYSAAVISGFLFTAIPNWTGRMPTRGWPLAGLGLLWLLGRIAMTGILGLSGLGVLLIDSSFLAAIAVMIAIEIIAGRNWRNLIVVAPVSLLFVTNVLFHAEVLSTGSSDYSRRLAFAVVLFLITLIGGRIIPSFTRNWLAKHNPSRLPTPYNRYDAACLAVGALAFGLWIGLPEANFTKGFLLLASLMHLVRLARWRGFEARKSFLLVMLHLAYLFLVAGLAATALAAPSVGFHLLGIGAIGGMTLAVMMRATLGHTGRDLEAGKILSALFILLMLTALARSFLAETDFAGLPGLWIAAGLWTLSYGGFVLVVGPWLCREKIAKRMPNRAQN